MEFEHRPVLLSECIDWMNIRPDGIYVDGTLGRGGHSEEIVRRLTGGMLLSIDRDERAIEACGERFEKYGEASKLIHGNFRDIDEIMNRAGIRAADGMLFDLGVSSPQLDDAERGFSYMMDSPLDMRMDKSDKLTAFEVVNRWEEDRLRRILYEYGEERYSPRIARAIARERAKNEIKTSFELVEIIRSAMPKAAQNEKQHPAKRSFQAIRIAVNDELAAVTEMIDAAVKRLNPGGRILVISFHSLEDRIVKNRMRALESGCTCPSDFPACVCGFEPALKVLTKKPVEPSEEEVTGNPRSRSAKLRVAEKLS